VCGVYDNSYLIGMCEKKGTSQANSGTFHLTKHNLSGNEVCPERFPYKQTSMICISCDVKIKKKSDSSFSSFSSLFRFICFPSLPFIASRGNYYNTTWIPE
jgi:hypothetical protein